MAALRWNCAKKSKTVHEHLNLRQFGIDDTLNNLSQEIIKAGIDLKRTLYYKTNEK
jgi:hypothetical protein